MSKMHIRTTINGDQVDFLGSPQQSLLDALRDEVGKLGTKEGCGTGDCGACSVIVDGRLVCSCLMLAAEAEGAEITTIEGIAEHAALQCGVCTPGFIVAAKALLDRNPNPDERTIRYWLAGNLCRCTGYDKIVRAVQDAAQELAHEA